MKLIYMGPDDYFVSIDNIYQLTETIPATQYSCVLIVKRKVVQILRAGN